MVKKLGIDHSLQYQIKIKEARWFYKGITNQYSPEYLVVLIGEDLFYRV